jgi:hypothetical protein
MKKEESICIQDLDMDIPELDVDIQDMVVALAVEAG